ncbi:MAG: 30S ribosomal protein S13 [Patescibacteria group bacterium]|jgi:small subunit ribosomal protein S13
MAVRIANVNLPDSKRVEIALTYLFGIGLTLSKKILAESKISPDTRVKNLTDAELEKIRAAVGRYRVEGDLKMEITQNIKRLKDISAYRGVRHTKGLPLRGQRTKTNARTKRGRKVTVGSGRKPSAQKT